MMSRLNRGYSILKQGIEPKVLKENTYLIPSQTDDKKYHVFKVGEGWICECLDFFYRRVECKHICAIKFWLRIREKLNTKKDLEKDISEEVKCIYCYSFDIVKDGKRKIENGNKQKFLCKICKRRFVSDIIKKVKGDGKIITLVLDLYFKGVSLRKIQYHLKQFYNLKVGHETVRRWILKFTQIMNDYANKLKPNTSENWHVDEQNVKVRGKWLWSWNLLDSETRFLIANTISENREINDAKRVFQEAKEITDNPKNIITDGLWSYEKAIKKEFATRTSGIKHIRLSTIREKPNNNLIERFHSTFRERDKVMRGFKAEHTTEAFSEGFRTYYNFIRNHQGLMNFTPSEVAGINLELGQNRWLGLLKLSIENKDLQKPKPKGKILWIIEVFDQQGKQVESGHGLQTRYIQKEKAERDLEFYRKDFEELGYRFELKEVEI